MMTLSSPSSHVAVFPCNSSIRGSLGAAIAMTSRSREGFRAAGAPAGRGLEFSSRSEPGALGPRWSVHSLDACGLDKVRPVLSDRKEDRATQSRTGRPRVPPGRGDHVAGVRTHTLVAVGAAVFTVSGAYGFADFARAPVVDPARVAAQIASGIGFIGAGAIVKDGIVVRGLTTAATLWLSAALGMAAGAGAYLPVAVGLILVMLVLVALRMVKPAARGIARAGPSLRITHRRDHDTLDTILRTVEAAGPRIKRLSISEDGQEQAATRTVLLEMGEHREHRLLRPVRRLARRGR
ncbi:MgtC/SapB family protein [Nonomuraea sp. MG754425]|uniref:MgtC/SapB family protein n=1 Tax=Nonomuraea sp. MG754425 TaxID=2570319 RepID=UPI0027E105C7|nr:MgtC/SapB family protein [Nonomuraea sp. MG754425]